MISSIESVLVVDDDTLMREFVVETLTRERIEVVQASNGIQARNLLQQREFDMAFVDIKMPGLSGMELLRWKSEKEVPTLTVIVTAFGTVEQAVEAMQLGAIDFLMKPFSPEQVELVLNKAREWVRLNAQNQYLKEELGWTMPGGRLLLGQSEAMKRLLSQIERVAASDSTVLISGESGTGKELVAQAIHGLGNRRQSPYVRMNCAAVPETLADSELFGHEKGAFTGAVGRRLGRFELAAGGTLLLDEISEMPLNLQAKLLRVIQEREFERVGGTRTLRADCRIVATTNRDLESYVREGGFRQDLYYRLNVVPIRVTPLRERADDVPVLAQAFLARFLKKMYSDETRLRFHPDTLACLSVYAWPGNVRELEHLVERLCVMEKGPELVPSMLPPEIRGGGEGEGGEFSSGPADDAISVSERSGRGVPAEAPCGAP
ncbi:MAG: sigma-54-dependent Fis family transcriptional regulator, partial [Lentisphaerae bacterium]|nr:sigma-54-dependent Fis family transcriptional regulator [Lentisphaerota bacterium]